MIPGIIASFEPIDIESYDLESPELEANQVLRDEFTAAGNIWGFGIFVRDPAYVGDPDSDVDMIAEYPGVGGGVTDPRGGILNLTVLREIDTDADTLRSSEISQFYLPWPLRYRRSHLRDPGPSNRVQDLHGERVLADETQDRPQTVCNSGHRGIHGSGPDELERLRRVGVSDLR